jgi:tetratricopeptide (TPR) repeat protein
MSFTKSSENVTTTRDEVYQALLRSLKRRKGFGIVFVQCSTAETANIIQRVQQDLPQKKIEVLRLAQPIDNLYDIIVNIPDRNELNILLIQGLEKSLEPYIKPGYGGDGDYYNLDTVPTILSHLNQRREIFRDRFSNICFVFILPLFAIKYFIRRAPDFFDWSTGVFAIESEQLEQESRQVLGLENFRNAGESLEQIKRSLAYFEQSLAICQKIGDRQGEANCLNNIGNAYQSLGQFERAISYYKQSLAIYRDLENHQGEADVLGNLGSAYYSLGQYEQAIWQILQKQAKSASNWLQFLTTEEMASVQRGTRALILPPPPPSVQKKMPTIPANQSLWMVIDLPFQNYQLLLLNRSQQGQALLCPSSAYAPNAIVEKSPILLPQKDAWAGNSEEKFVFGDVGKEEFLAIVLEKPLSLPWLTPREDEALPEWNADRMKELFEQLEQQGNWQVFYQSFEVVE